jgi:hypothetical protein
VGPGLHVPTFLKQCQQLWDTPAESLVQEVYTPFLSLYLAILCVSMIRSAAFKGTGTRVLMIPSRSTARSIFHGPEGSAPPFHSTRTRYSAREMAQRFSWSKSRDVSPSDWESGRGRLLIRDQPPFPQSLWQSDFMAVHTIEHLQTITLMGIFLNTQDRADAAWSLLGAAIKVSEEVELQSDDPADPSFSLVFRWVKGWACRD